MTLCEVITALLCLNYKDMKKYIIIFWIIIFLLITQFSSNFKGSTLTIKTIPADFKYDWCSMFPNGNYLECCTEHDKAYFFWWDWKNRIKADAELSQCVQSKWWTFHNILWPAMFLWVRIWWAPIFPTSFRWWFGRDRY